MREEVLAQMEAARANPEKAGTARDFRFEALQVSPNPKIQALIASLRFS